MKRSAVPADLPLLIALRDASGADALSDPALINETALARLIAVGAVTVCDDDDGIAGFVAVDGPAIRLLVDSARRGGGIGRALLADACAGVQEKGHTAATLTLAFGSTAERHYLAAGWAIVEKTPSGGLVLRKPL